MNIGDRITVTPKADGKDITKGHTYKAEVYMKAIDETGIVFAFKDDTGFLRIAKQFDSNHINKNDWEIENGQ